jgi:protein-tyrosine phosphatase
MLLRKVLIVAVASAATIAAQADVVNLHCVETAPAQYRLTYELTDNTHSVTILAGAEANQIPSSPPLSTTSVTTVTLQAGKPDQRVYFYLKADTGEVREVSIRQLPLEGTPNFRDLGGYRTTDGRIVRWGLLYRSSVLTYLTPSDYRYLSHLGIRVICDFRSQHENEIAPETWIPGSSVDKIRLPIDGRSAGGANKPPSMQALFNPADTPEQLRQHMIATYGNWVFTSSDQYAAVFQQLKNDHLPLLYHCTGGADRTGVFSALLLLTLGVPEETVLADYALTREYLGDLLTSNSGRMLLKASGSDIAESIKRLTPEQRRAIVTDPEYLRATLRRIDAKYGSFDNYRREALHVSDADVETLRARLTED